jgi:glycosyltransferase involved in cell wall biosynthesis
LFILNNLEGGGAEKVFVNIANGFMDANISVAFLLGEKKGVYLNLLNPSIPITESGGTSFRHYLGAFPNIFKQGKYSHIFTATDYTSAAALLTKKISGISAKIFVTHHYNLPQNRTLKNWTGDRISQLIHQYLFPRADKIIAVSNGSLAWLKRNSKNELSKAITIYNPVFDESIFIQATEKINYPVEVNGKIILVSAGRLEEQKDQLTLLKAFHILKLKQPGYILFILGNGPLKQPLKNYIALNQLENDVFLVGFQTNPYKWIVNCNVFVSSSISEGFGNVLVEAMALGKTVVSTNCPSGPAEILQNGALGYLCEVKNPEALAESILQAVAKPFDAEILKAASQQFTIREIVKKYIEQLQRFTRHLS